jgi:GxxExxY protein
MNAELIYKEESYQIIGCCMEVYNNLRPGFLEGVYQEALALEFENAGVEFVQEAPLTILYKGKPLLKKYFADFLCFSKIIVEIKAVSNLAPDHYAQVKNYIAATGLKLGLLVNFGNPEKLEYSRVLA